MQFDGNDTTAGNFAIISNPFMSDPGTTDPGT